MEHWKYSYDYNPTFTNESNFYLKQPIRSWYAIKKIKQTYENNLPTHPPQ